MFISDLDAKKRLEGFLEDSGFSFAELHEITNDNYLIFGGAVKSAIAGEDVCNDIDILVCDHSKFTRFNTVKKYDRNEYAKDTVGRKVQLPGKDKQVDLLTPYGDIIVFKTFVDFLSEVDINVCGIGFNNQFGFIETSPDQIRMCRRKCFKVNVNANGYDSYKTPSRIEKLVKLDWMRI